MTLRIIAGRLRGRHLRVPHTHALRPTSDRVREALFNILAPWVQGRIVYDLFAGSGALGIEALSRGASQAIFVERDRSVVQLLRQNLRELALSEQSVVVCGDVFHWARRTQDWRESPAIALLDPPYDELHRRPKRLAELTRTLQEHLAPGSIIVLESDSRFDARQLPQPDRWELRRYGQTQLAIYGLVTPSSVENNEDHEDHKTPLGDHHRAGYAGTGRTPVRESTRSRKEHFAREVVGRLRGAGFQALWAGGCVRDRLLGRDPEDYDVATNARPEQVRQVFGRRRTVEVGAAFGVVEVLGPHQAGKVQVATFRSDVSYSDGRHPDQVVYGNPQEDAARRDFTINGMFYDPTAEQVIDYVGGQQDLAAGVVRAIGDPRERFAEDKLRLIRAVRFTATLGFRLDPLTEQSLRELASEIRVVSAERIAEELRRMLVHEHRAHALRLAFDAGLIHAILPELVSTKGLPQGKPVQPNGDLWDHMLLVLDKLDDAWQRVMGTEEPRDKGVPFPLAMAALLHDVGKPATYSEVEGKITFHHHEHRGREIAESICRRLRLSNKETDRICWLVEYHMYLGEAKQMRWAKLKRILVEPAIEELLALHWADALASTGDTSQVEYVLQVWRELPEEELNPPPLLTGHDLIRHGVPQGPIYQELLEAVRDVQLEGRIRTKREALALVDQWLTQKSEGDPGD